VIEFSVVLKKKNSKHRNVNKEKSTEELFKLQWKCMVFWDTRKWSDCLILIIWKYNIQGYQNSCTVVNT